MRLSRVVILSDFRTDVSGVSVMQVVYATNNLLSTVVIRLAAVTPARIVTGWRFCKKENGAGEAAGEASRKGEKISGKTVCYPPRERDEWISRMTYNFC